MHATGNQDEVCISATWTVTLNAGQSRTILKKFWRNAIRPSSRGAAGATGEKKRGNKLHQSYKPLSPVCTLAKIIRRRVLQHTCNMTTLCGMWYEQVMNMGYELRAMEKCWGFNADLHILWSKFRLTKRWPITQSLHCCLGEVLNIKHSTLHNSQLENPKKGHATE